MLLSKLGPFLQLQGAAQVAKASQAVVARSAPAAPAASRASLPASPACPAEGEDGASPFAMIAADLVPTPNTPTAVPKPEPQPKQQQEPCSGPQAEIPSMPSTPVNVPSRKPLATPEVGDEEHSPRRDLEVLYGPSSKVRGASSASDSKQKAGTVEKHVRL